jgi:DNA-binding NtrC family response regulator
MTMNPSPSALETALSKRLRGGRASPDRHPIVVIDDDETSRNSLAFILADQYHVTVCASAKEGVAAVHEDVCAVILDVRMPEQDGFSACAEIRQKVPDVPVIFYSAYQSVKDPYEIINDHHPFGYVTKGDDLQKIVKLVNMAVKIHSTVVYNRKLIHNLKNTQDPAR